MTCVGKTILDIDDPASDIFMYHKTTVTCIKIINSYLNAEEEIEAHRQKLLDMGLGEPSQELMDSYIKSRETQYLGTWNKFCDGEYSFENAVNRLEQDYEELTAKGGVFETILNKFKDGNYELRDTTSK